MRFLVKGGKNMKESKEILKFKWLVGRLREIRYNFVKPLVIGNNVLDIGCSSTILKGLFPSKNVVCADINKGNGIQFQNIESMTYEDNQFDTVVCTQVLEHVSDPVKAMKELLRVCGERLIVSVPYEPYFTLFRLGRWEPLHLWTIRPETLIRWLGKPTFTTLLVFRRYFMGVWEYD